MKFKDCFDEKTIDLWRYGIRLRKIGLPPDQIFNDMVDYAREQQTAKLAKKGYKTLVRLRERNRNQIILSVLPDRHGQ